MTNEITQEHEPKIEAQVDDTGACVSISVTASKSYYKKLESPSGDSKYDKWSDDKFLSIKMERQGQALNPVKTVNAILEDIRKVIK